jgi:FAD binding domain
VQMSALTREITTSETSLDEKAVGELRKRFRGELLLPTDAGYEEHRRVWNAAIDRYPSLIARCTGTRDVVEVVKFARERDLTVSVRGGGHNIAWELHSPQVPVSHGRPSQSRTSAYNSGAVEDVIPLLPCEVVALDRRRRSVQRLLSSCGYEPDPLEPDTERGYDTRISMAWGDAEVR